jgi:PTS system mannose-specific IIC component
MYEVEMAKESGPHDGLTSEGPTDDNEEDI